MMFDERKDIVQFKHTQEQPKISMQKSKIISIVTIIPVKLLLIICVSHQIFAVYGINPPSSFFGRTLNAQIVCRDLRGGGWFGKSESNNDDEEEVYDANRNQPNKEQTYYPPPPPFPPPPPPLNTEEEQLLAQTIPPPPPQPSSPMNDENEGDEMNTQELNDHFEPMMYNPYEYYNPNQPPIDPSSPYYYPPPQQQWQTEQQYQDQQEEYESLTSKIQNLTLEIQNYSNESTYQLREIDSLTEEVSNLSNQLAHEQILLKEIQYNSTLYYDRWKESESALEGLEEVLEDMKEQKKKWEKLQEEMEYELEEKKTQMEDLSFAVEQIRENQEEEVLQRKSLSSLPSSIPINTKKSGFFTSLFNLLLMRSSSNVVPILDDQDTKTLNLTRTTLTMALTQTRQHVTELENVIDTLTQNNTAISEVVESRDALISELHSRVQVFEEDKLVLKAALRQLQREMKEEIGPAREKLEVELQEKREDIAHLQNTITSLEQTHENQLMKLQTQLADSRKELNTTTAEITAIGLYVDKLEERLANFAISKREFEKEKENTREEVVEILEGVQSERLKWISEKEQLTTKLEGTKDLLKEKEDNLETMRLHVLELEAEKEEMQSILKDMNEHQSQAFEDDYDDSEGGEIYHASDNEKENTPPLDPISASSSENVEVTVTSIVVDETMVSDNEPIGNAINNEEMECFVNQTLSEQNDEKILPDKRRQIHYESPPPLPNDNASVSSPQEMPPQKNETLVGDLDNVNQNRQIDTARKEKLNQNKNRMQLPPISPPPFRRMRKVFSKVTGMHGTFTPMYEERKRRQEFMQMMRKRDMMMKGNGKANLMGGGDKAAFPTSINMEDTQPKQN